MINNWKNSNLPYDSSWVVVAVMEMWARNGSMERTYPKLGNTYHQTL